MNDIGDFRRMKGDMVKPRPGTVRKHHILGVVLAFQPDAPDFVRAVSGGVFGQSESKIIVEGIGRLDVMCRDLDVVEIDQPGAGMGGNRRILFCDWSMLAQNSTGTPTGSVICNVSP